MMTHDAPKPPSTREQIMIAVAIAALTTAATHLVGWGMDKLFDWADPERKEKKEEKDK